MRETKHRVYNHFIHNQGSLFFVVNKTSGVYRQWIENCQTCIQQWKKTSCPCICIFHEERKTDNLITKSFYEFQSDLVHSEGYRLFDR